MSRKIYIQLVILCSLFLSFLVFSQDEDSIEEKLVLCKELKNSSKRLQCYDNITTYPLAIVDSHEKTLQKMPPILADLEEPRVFSAMGQITSTQESFNAVLLGVGTRMKLKTFDLTSKFSSLDFNAIGLIKSQFDTRDFGERNNSGGILLNTDFMIGGELVKSYENSNIRLKYFHRSTHLGDEFLINNPSYLDDRLNLSYEALDFLYYRHHGKWGSYLGASFITRSEPGSLEKFQVQTGFQYRGDKHNWYTPIGGVDFKSWQASDWNVNASFKAGIEFAGFLDQPLQLMFEYYEGKSPYGQFFNEDLEFMGLSINHYW